MAERKVQHKLLKRKRLFASLKRQSQFLAEYDQAIHIGQVQCRLDKLEEKWEQFEEVQDEIASLDEKGICEKESDEAGMEFETLYYELRAALLEKLASQPGQNAANLDTTVGRNTSASGFHSGVRLPQISLPEFNGDYTGWLSFKSTYVSLIHDSVELSDVQKFHYLKSALKGEAAKLIETLPLTNESYIIAWETISKRYSNEYLLKKRHLQALMEYPKLGKESAAEIHGLVDEFEQRLKILKQLGEKTEHWGALIVHWMCSKLDMHTLQLWEDHAASMKEPTFSILVEFLEKRTRVLDAVSSNVVESSQESSRPINRPKKMLVHAATENDRSLPVCQCCGDHHYLTQCPKFSKMGIKEKLEVVNSKRLCSNCFRSGHWVRDCHFKFSCRTCGKKHNSLIHPGFPPRIEGGNSSTEGVRASQRVEAQRASSNLATGGGDEEQTEAGEDGPVGSYSVKAKGGAASVFLSTVVLAIRDHVGSKQLARALLDNGSQANIMSERMCQMLKLKRRAVNVPICGVGQSESRAKHAVHAMISSRVTDFSVEVDFLVLQRVTSDLPSVSVPVSNWKIPEELRLADPDFNTSKRIDLIIGAEHFYRFLYEREMRQIPLGLGLPVLVDTVFGWIVSGKSTACSGQAVSCCLATTTDNLESLLEKFWTVESCEDRPPWSVEEQDCEEDFLKGHSRADDGRYIVRLPKQVNFERMIGESKRMALERFRKLENRLERDAELKSQYHAFMKEYVDLGHMRKITEEELRSEATEGGKRKAYYLPHHAVVKDSSTTTKVRVVFDGSARTDSGYSLNDGLLKGPIIQDELLSLLLRFRRHEVALVADVEKMYRQVRLHKDDTPLQRIFWRFSDAEPIAIYELETVTYGLTPSSFLATRALQQLAADERADHPEASAALVKDFYVDDYIGGASSVPAAIRLREELSGVMSKGGFLLRKWCSNRPEVLVGIPEDQLGTNLSITFDFDPGEKVKTLGITWEPGPDHLRFVFDIGNEEDIWTRRSILSCIARLFDPLGIISPIVVTAKIIMQELALLQTEWDEPVPSSLEDKWKTFHSQLNKLAELRINRFAFISDWVDVQLHCFADASELAYGACLYVRAKDRSGNVHVELLASKSRVAPLKRLTLPRLELCAAREAAVLYSKVIKALGSEDILAFFWSDSTVVLHWLMSPPNTWKTFIANRVSTIQTLTYGHPWKHIAGKENPADLVSRGMPVEEFLQSQLWKCGPPWLVKEMETWPVQIQEISLAEPELETRKVVHTVAVSEPDPLFTLRSSLKPLLRIVAYCIRFFRNSRYTDQVNRAPLLTVEEISAAKQALIRCVQAECFTEEIRSLQKKHLVPSKSSLKLLRPFLDKNGIVRVGGRLGHSRQNFSVKHPAVVPSSHPFTRLLIEHFHKETKHGGRQLTLSAMRQEFWPIHGKRAVDAVLRKCIPCFRTCPVPVQQPIGQLPAERVRPSRPFAITGVDYCGPFYLKPPHRRAAAPKAYIAVFVCFTTKAMHLEVVSDLSTVGFLSAFRRFIGHHGIPTEMHSDNAKNFAGAKQELIELYEILNNPSSLEQIGLEFAHQGIAWHFIPPRAPNFGGLWERAVRSVKTAMKKEIGTRQLPLEELSTLLVQIAAALNSRPLAPLSDDPSDLEALTPAHFLIGSIMNSLPEPDLKNIPTNRLVHYQQRQQMFQQYWERWRQEYLTELQLSTKSIQPSIIRVGTLIVLREDNLPPLCWPLARIVEVHPGLDGVVRVVSIRTASGGVYKRPICRICPLPDEAAEDIAAEGSSHEEISMEV